jgi:hypothetical protein
LNIYLRDFIHKNTVTIPGGYDYQEVTIDYTYDGLYRLTKAEYSTGELFEYAMMPTAT